MKQTIYGIFAFSITFNSCFLRLPKNKTKKLFLKLMTKEGLKLAKALFIGKNMQLAKGIKYSCLLQNGLTEYLFPGLKLFFQSRKPS